MFSINHILTDEVVKALGLTLIHVIWQGFLIAFLMAVILKFVKNYSSQLRYYIACLSLLLIVGFSVIDFIEYYDNPIQLIEYGQVNASENLMQIITVDNTINEIETGNTIRTYFFVFISKIDIYFPLIVNIWLIGILVFLLRFIIGLTYSQRIKHYNIQYISDYWERNFYKIEKKLNIRKKIKYLESQIIKVPVVLGYLKPVIIVPAGMLMGIPENQIEAIIAHELAHIKRNDYLVNILQTIIEMIFFFHPAVWYISSTIRTERENCCDDIALTVCDESLIYAKALVSVQELYPDKVYSAVAFSGQKKQLLNRIKRMIMKPKMKSNLTDKIIASLIVIIGIVIITISTSLKAESPEPIAMVTNDAPMTIEIIQPEIPGEIPIPDEVEIVKMIIRDTTKINKKCENINIENNTITKSFTDKDGKKKEMKISLKNGKVVDLYVDGNKISESEYKKYQPEVDETIADLKEAKEDIKDAMKEIEEIDFDKIRKDVEEAMKDVHIDMAEIQKEIAHSLEEIKNIDTDQIIKDIELNIDRIKDIDLEKEMIELNKSIQEIQNIDMEEFKLQMEEARIQMENINLDEIRAEIEKNKELMLKDIDMDAIQKEMLKAQEEIAKIDMGKIRTDMEESFKKVDKEKIIGDMEKELEKLESLELEEN
ncbi:MAG: hypothetical protein A2041_01005 [Bacteroidetes bacterium GWA2_31_9b]|nr:MAG: hypothetical protein A2041_01005 [Bacteroidetes bacterium GWA2_31_9b]